MSKNLTRKGLALGAVVALGSSLFAGAPAFAAPALQVAPATGTGYTVLSSDTFALKVVGNSEYTLNADSNLYWKITKPSATSSVSYTTSPAGTDTPAAYSTSTVEYINATGQTVVAGATTLTLDPSITTSASADYVVQAFIESGLTDGLDGNDTVVSPAVTVKFVRGADQLPIVTLDQVSDGQAATGTVTFPAADFNYAQSTVANTKVLININGGSFSASQDVTRNDTNTAFEFSIADDTASVDVGEVAGVKAEAVAYDDATVAGKVYSTVKYSTADAASDADAQETTVTVGENIKENSAGAYAVRTGTKSFSYRVDFTKGNYAVAGGKAVQITVTEDGTNDATLVTNDVIRVNGKKLTGSATTGQTAVLNTVTDADGGVTVTVESELGLVSDKIEVAVKATGVAVTSTQTFEWTDAVIWTVAEAAAPLGSATRTLVKGSPVSIKYEIRDQFGKLWTKTGSTYQLRAVGAAGTLVLNTTQDFSAGVATLSFTDNSTSADADTTVTATVYVKTTGDYSQETGFNTSNDQVVSTLNIVTAAQAATKITPAIAYTGASYNSTIASSADGVASATADRSTVTLAAQDLRSNVNGASLGSSDGQGVKISGTAYNVDGSAAAGVAVTISAAGVFFSTDYEGSSYVSKDSITLNTDTSGGYAVYVLSNKGGTFTVNIASGSVTKTQKIKFAAAAATAGKTIAITAPDAILPGRSVDVSVLLTDSKGAPVTTSGSSDIDVTVTGVGYATTIADDTDVDGKLAFKMIFGATEVGTATITVKYDADGDGTAYLPVTATKVISIVTTLPTTSTVAISASTGKFYTSVTNAAGKKVVVKVAGKFVKSFIGTAAKKTLVTKTTKGSKKVTVFVGGKLVATKTINVR